MRDVALGLRHHLAAGIAFNLLPERYDSLTAKDNTGQIKICGETTYTWQSFGDNRFISQGHLTADSK
jgi:hypothetical protein